MIGPAALAGLAALVAYGHRPSPMAPDAPLLAEKFTLASQATESFLLAFPGDAPIGVVAFGEIHQTEQTKGVRSSIARFTDEILPKLAPRAGHLIVETWISRGSCGEAERKVTADVARTTERPAETENEIVRLLRRAKELGVAPHLLDIDCHEYRALTGKGGAVDYDKLLTITGQHLGRAIEQALALPRPAGRPLVLVYGGALHNDLAPGPETARYSFGPAIDALTQGAYREIDLFVPQLVDAYPTLRGERWYAPWRAVRARPGATLIRRGPRSAVLVFEDEKQHLAKYRSWLDPRTVAVLEAPDRIEAFALHDWRPGRPPPGHENDPPPRLPPGAPTEMGGRVVYAIGKPLSVDFARRLTAALLDDATYNDESPPFGHRLFKSCALSPDVGYRIWSGQRSIDLMFCFLCDQVEVIPEPTSYAGWAAGDVDPARAAFVALAKEALPGLPEIATLPAVRPAPIAPTPPPADR